MFADVGRCSGARGLNGTYVRGARGTAECVGSLGGISRGAGRCGALIRRMGEWCLASLKRIRGIRTLLGAMHFRCIQNASLHYYYITLGVLYGTVNKAVDFLLNIF